MSRLEENIALNLKRIRKSRNMSLDMMAEKTGVSKSMLGQIERGESNPTVSTIGKIVEGIRVPFEELLYQKEDAVSVVQYDELPACREQKQEYEFKTIFPYDKIRKFEVFSGRIEAGASCASNPHGEGAVEYVTVTKGRMILTVGKKTYEVKERQAVRFCANEPHCYENPEQETLQFQVLMSYEAANVF